MCGIIGGINVSWNDDPLLDIAHRGPDSSGWYNDRKVSLGHVRLSIQDLSIKSNQPMISKDGSLILIFNGEIYNHWEIREILTSKGYHFLTTSDTETLLVAWECWGSKSLDIIIGIFAFAIYDRKAKEVIIARDPFGVKPLYVYKNGNIFSFCSEIKGLIKLNNFDSTLNIKAIINYTSFLWSPGEITMYKRVSKVLPGQMIKINAQTGLSSEDKIYTKSHFRGEYWEYGSEKEWIDLLEEKLINAIERQMISDVPLGFFLSGGLDSSLIVAIANKLYPQNNYDCFTINLETYKGKEGFVNDYPFAKRVAEYLGVRLHEVSPKNKMVDLFDKMIWHLDEPQADLAPINVYEISSLAQSHGIKVLLGGVGSDDIFSGYRRHNAISLEKYVNIPPKLFMSGSRSLLNMFPSHYPLARRLKKLSRDWGEPLDQQMLGYFNWLPSNNHAPKLLSNQVSSEISNYDPYYYAKNLIKSSAMNLSRLDLLLLLEQKTFLVDHNLNYTDKLSMAAGLEARVPYLDDDLVEFAGHIPSSLKIKNGEKKYLLKKVAERYLPKDVIYRPKTGFGAPVRDMITDDFNSQLNSRLNPSLLQEQGVFSSEIIQTMIKSHKKGSDDYGYTLLSLLSIQSWLKQFPWSI
jgi:asparagine synthase (glutamine-hydrolysing)